MSRDGVQILLKCSWLGSLSLRVKIILCVPHLALDFPGLNVELASVLPFLLAAIDLHTTQCLSLGDVLLEPRHTAYISSATLWLSPSPVHLTFR